MPTRGWEDGGQQQKKECIWGVDPHLVISVKQMKVGLSGGEVGRLERSRSAAETESRTESRVVLRERRGVKEREGEEKEMRQEEKEEEEGMRQEE